MHTYIDASVEISSDNMYANYLLQVLYQKSKENTFKSLGRLKLHSCKMRTKRSTNCIIIKHESQLPLMALVMINDAPCFRLPLGYN